MFDKKGRRNGNNRELESIIKGSTSVLLSVIEKVSRNNESMYVNALSQFEKLFFATKILQILARKEKRKINEDATRFLIHVVKVDTATEELISRSFKETYAINPNTKQHFESMEDLGFTYDDMEAMKHLRKIRNMFAHSYNPEELLTQLFEHKGQKKLFEKTLQCTLKIVERERNRIRIMKADIKVYTNEIVSYKNSAA